MFDRMYEVCQWMISVGWMSGTLPIFRDYVRSCLGDECIESNGNLSFVYREREASAHVLILTWIRFYLVFSFASCLFDDAHG
jgi:hypothetical protein